MPDMINLPICYKYVNLINHEKKSTRKKNLIPKFTHILIDRTFYICPKGYYQIINISGYYPNINEILPLFIS